MYWRILLYVSVIASSLYQLNHAAEHQDLQSQFLSVNDYHRFVVTDKKLLNQAKDIYHYIMGVRLGILLWR